ncbi:MAG TPA: DMT family transporter [Terriglobales bacterium]|nr:DMT family transporter [Terriglobales bacterium]
MIEYALGLIVFAAVVHATWNFLAKSAHDSLAFMWWMYGLGTVGYLFLILPLMGIYLDSASYLPFLVSSLAEAGYVVTLTKGYDRGDLSLVYPISRGGAPILTAVFAGFLGERLPILGIVGIGFSVAGVCFLSLSEISQTKGLAMVKRGSTWALACAAFIAVYSVSDNIAVTFTSPLIYIWWVFLGNSLLTLPFVWQRSRLACNISEIRSNWKRIVLAGSGSLVAYLAILLALRLTSVSYVVTGRALSVLVAAVLGVFLLKEKFGRERSLGAGLMILGMAIIQLFGS